MCVRTHSHNTNQTPNLRLLTTCICRWPRCSHLFVHLATVHQGLRILFAIAAPTSTSGDDTSTCAATCAYIYIYREKLATLDTAVCVAPMPGIYIRTYTSHPVLWATTSTQAMCVGQAKPGSSRPAATAPPLAEFMDPTTCLY